MTTIRPDISNVLMQMRDMQMQAQSQVGPAADVAAGPQKAGAPEFGEMFNDAVNNVNDTQMTAGKLAAAYEQGDPNVDLTQVMVSLQKANLSFQAMTQVRNRLVSAYQDIMKMPI